MGFGLGLLAKLVLADAFAKPRPPFVHYTAFAIGRTGPLPDALGRGCIIRGAMGLKDRLCIGLCCMFPFPCVTRHPVQTTPGNIHSFGLLPGHVENEKISDDRRKYGAARI